jgi:hypothetical protein
MTDEARRQHLLDLARRARLFRQVGEDLAQAASSSRWEGSPLSDAMRKLQELSSSRFVQREQERLQRERDLLAEAEFELLREEAKATQPKEATQPEEGEASKPAPDDTGNIQAGSDIEPEPIRPGTEPTVDDVVREEIRAVNKKAKDDGARNGPNVKVLFKLVQPRLIARHFDITREEFDKIADEAEFENQRGRVGRRLT